MADFSAQIAKLLMEVLEEYERSEEKAVEKFAVNFIMRVSGVSEEEARKMVGEILEGLRAYEELSQNRELLQEKLNSLSPEERQLLEEEAEALKERFIKNKNFEEGKNG